MITYKFNGYTFRPVRKLSDGETGAMLTQRLESDLEHRAVFSRANGGKYSHAAFYAAMGKTDADIFYCQETHKNYLPCKSELFIYNN